MISLHKPISSIHDINYVYGISRSVTLVLIRDLELGGTVPADDCRAAFLRRASNVN